MMSQKGKIKWTRFLCVPEMQSFHSLEDKKLSWDRGWILAKVCLGYISETNLFFIMRQG